MRKSIFAALVLGLFVASLGSPATAGKSKAATLFLHGTETVGEAELPSTWLESAMRKMDAVEPDGATPKSLFVTNYVGGPNTQCSGNGLLPVWKADMTGKVKGTVTVTLHTIATPAARMNVELFADGTGGCESSLGSTGYTPPVEAQVVDVAPGPAVTEVTFKNVNFKTFTNLVLQLSVPQDTPDPSQIRVLFDSPDYASSVQISK